MFEVVAHHPLLQSLPFFAPVLAICIGLAMLAIRERLRNR